MEINNTDFKNIFNEINDINYLIYILYEYCKNHNDSYEILSIEAFAKCLKNKAGSLTGSILEKYSEYLS